MSAAAPPPPALPSLSTRWWAGLAVPLIAIGAVYALRIDDAAGLMVDDAWYIVLAKALAAGEGYRLISSATTAILPAVPPGFPALLSPVVLAVPRFPDHVIWMKLLSVAAVLTAGAICWRDFTRHRGTSPASATLIVAAALLTPALVFLATSTVMAEGAYLLAQVAAVAATERITRRDASDQRAPIIAALLAAMTMLLRSSAAALVAAAVVYLLIARRWRQAAIFTGVVVLCLLPWTLYATAHAPTAAERAAHGGSMAYSYSQLLTTARLEDAGGDAVTAGALLERAAQNLAVVVTRDVGAVLLPVMYRGPDESGQEVFSIGRPGMGDMGVARGTMLVSVLVGLIILAGWLASPRERFAMPGLLLAATLPMIAPVVGQTFRYLIPLAPYLVLLFWRGLRSAAVARIALLIVIGLHAMDHAGYLYQKSTGTAEWLADWRENREVVTWIDQNLPGDATLAATNPGLIYLGSNRHTRAIDGMARNWEQWKQDGIRYVVSTVPGGELPSKSLGWQLRFRSDRHGLWVVEIDD
jgi:hypothetical protein